VAIDKDFHNVDVVPRDQFGRFVKAIAVICHCHETDFIQNFFSLLLSIANKESVEWTFGQTERNFFLFLLRKKETVISRFMTTSF
jgi:hypothetical protein